MRELTLEQVRELYATYINTAQANIYSKLSFARDLFIRADGMYIYTDRGRRILDFTGGIGVLNHGHNHQRILSARKTFQDNQEMEVHKQVFSPYMAALAHNVACLLPGDLTKSFFPNSGAEAVEGALKLAYRYHHGSRTVVLHSDVSFHGNLIGSGSISAASGYKQKFQVLPEVAEFKYNDIDSVYDLIDQHRRADGTSNIYALIVEPFHASSLLHCSNEHLVALRSLCTREEIILIFDEVYTGWGETGELFNFCRVDKLIPDIVTMSKSFGGGKSSISCYVTTDKVFDSAYGNIDDALLHTSTYNGFGEESITALEAVNIVIEDNYVEKSRAIGRRLKVGLEKLKETHNIDIAEVRGSGSLMGLVLNSLIGLVENSLTRFPNKLLRKKGELLKKAATLSLVDYLYEQHGILTHINNNPNWVVFMITPSLIVSDKEIDQFLDSLDQALQRGLKTLVPRFLYKYIVR